MASRKLAQQVGPWIVREMKCAGLASARSRAWRQVCRAERVRAVGAAQVDQTYSHAVVVSHADRDVPTATDDCDFRHDSSSGEDRRKVGLPVLSVRATSKELRSETGQALYLVSLIR